MGWWHGWGARARGLLRRGAEERELDEEMRFHVEMEAGKLEREGLDHAEARREALRRFGGVERMKERTRDERGTRLIEDAWMDLGYTVRTLRRAPGFALLTLVTLSLGIGGTTAMFSLVDGVLLAPLPYPDADRMISVWERTEEGRPIEASYPNFADWRSGGAGLDALAAYVPPRAATVLLGTGGVRATVCRVSEDFFRVAGVGPSVGRLPAPDEHRPGAAPVAVVSHAFWEGSLGAPAVLTGTVLDIDGTVFDVVGVMPPGFAFPEPTDVWTSLDRAVPWTVRGNHVVRVAGRLADGARVETVREALDRVHAGIRAASDEVETVGVVVRPSREEVVGDAGRALLLLLGAAGTLLLVACANVASTLLARGTGRLPELAVRASLGAGRARLIRQLFLESLTLAALGAGGGVATARGILALTRALDPGAVPRLAEVSVDAQALAFALAAAIGTALLFGLLPSLSMTRADVAGSAREGRSGYGRRTRTVWRVLMAVEVAMAVVLLVSGTLLARSLGAVLGRDGGFRADGVVAGRVHAPLGKYPGWEEATAALDRLLTGVRSAPGVTSAGVTLMLPVPGQGSVGSRVTLQDGSRPDRIFHYGVADAGYFETLEIPLVRGRLFGPDDGPGSPHVAVVDEAMAEALWPGQDPLGRRFSIAGMDPWPTEDLTVIGVVGETVRWDREPGASPTYYVHYAQRPAFLGLFGMSVVARGAEVASGAVVLRERVRAADPDMTVSVSTLSASIANSAGDRRFQTFVLSGFALAALVLAAVGVYGVVAYAVARRTREIGIRIALGARPEQVRGTVQREVLVTVAVGGASGLMGAALAGRALGRLLFEVSPLDPASFTLGAAVLGLAAWAASWLPAWRGARVDPAAVLRRE